MNPRRPKVSPGRSASVSPLVALPARRRAPGEQRLGESTASAEALIGDGDLDTPRSPWLDNYYRFDREQGTDGFMPPEMAAVQMGLTIEELAALLDRGHLSARAIGSSVWVRPAVITRMR